VLEAPSVETVEKEVNEYSGLANGELGNGILHSKESVAEVSDEDDESSETAEEQKAREEESARRKLAADIAAEVAKRRNFAIISHPDAGKTTLVSALFPSVTAFNVDCSFSADAVEHCPGSEKFAV
jgi:ABC-type transport system involved in cytochrome bd biosynthesis fused ATPase/permease subunit